MISALFAVGLLFAGVHFPVISMAQTEINGWVRLDRPQDTIKMEWRQDSYSHYLRIPFRGSGRQVTAVGLRHVLAHLESMRQNLADLGGLSEEGSRNESLNAGLQMINFNRDSFVRFLTESEPLRYLAESPLEETASDMIRPYAWLAMLGFGANSSLIRFIGRSKPRLMRSILRRFPNASFHIGIISPLYCIYEIPKIIEALQRNSDSAWPSDRSWLEACPALDDVIAQSEGIHLPEEAQGVELADLPIANPSVNLLSQPQGVLWINANGNVSSRPDLQRNEQSDASIRLTVGVIMDPMNALGSPRDLFQDFGMAGSLRAHRLVKLHVGLLAGQRALTERALFPFVNIGVRLTGLGGARSGELDEILRTAETEDRLLELVRRGARGENVTRELSVAARASRTDPQNSAGSGGLDTTENSSRRGQTSGERLALPNSVFLIDASFLTAALPSQSLFQADGGQEEDGPEAIEEE